MKKHTEYGIAHLTLIFAVLIIGTVGFVGMRVSSRNNTQSTVSTATPTRTTVKTSTINETVPSTITTKTQVQKAIKVTDDSSIDTDLDSSTLNDDIDNF